MPNPVHPAFDQAASLSAALASGELSAAEVGQLLRLILPPLFASASPGHLAEIAIALPFDEVSASGARKANRRLALEVGERLDYDAGQSLYRFAVLATKLI